MRLWRLCCSVGLLCGVNVRESVEKLPPQTAVAAPKEFFSIRTLVLSVFMAEYTD